MKKLRTLLVLILSIFICHGFSISNAAQGAVSNATTIFLNTDYTGQISSKNDAKWYKFTTTSNKSFYRLELKNLSIKDNCYFEVYTKNNEREFRDCFYYNKGDNDQYLKLEKNTTYYIKVTSYKTGNYKLKVCESKDDIGDDKNSSKSIQLNKFYTGSINAKKTYNDKVAFDEDYYKFTTTKNNSFYRFDTKNLNIEDSCYFEIYTKDDEREYRKTLYRNREESDEYLKLEKNTTYYVRVTCDKVGKYKFKIQEVKDDAPDSMKTSKQIYLNKTYNGSINAKKTYNDKIASDEDWYKFTTNSSDTNYTFNIKNNNIEDIANFYILTKDDEEKFSDRLYKKHSSSNKIKLLKNTTYYIKVNSNTPGQYSFSISSKTSLEKVTNLKSINTSSSSIKLSWNKVSTATGYKIERATSKKGPFKQVAIVKGNSYNDTRLSNGKTYYYRVRAYTSSTNGAYSSTISATTNPAKPIVALSNPKTKTVKVSWYTVYGANGYEVYRSTSKNGKYSLIKRTSGKSYTNYNLSQNKTYYYKVKAYKIFNGKKVYSDYSTLKYIKVK